MIEKFEIHTDVLVLGSGPSGFAAAYSAAKNGAKVILVEQSGDVGGISTSGLMSHWTGSCGSPLYYEILKRTSENNEGEFKNKITNLIDPEKLKTLYLEMLCEVGCKVMLYTFAEDAICDGDKIVLRKRDNKGWLAGLYEFPSMEGHVEENEVITQLENMGYKVLHIKKLTDGKHIFSHV